MTRYTPRDVAERYQVGESTVQRWCRTRRIGHIRTPGGQYRGHPTGMDATW